MVMIEQLPFKQNNHGLEVCRHCELKGKVIDTVERLDRSVFSEDTYEVVTRN